METVPSFTEIMRLLLDPAAYPHSVETVHLAQTHISCVFLTGEYVYKVKKPVDFGFLDYRSLPKRHLWCEQEVRLNRRLCPDLYLDVLPITVECGQLRIGGSGAPIEWAVRMKQMREEDTLPQRLRTHSVTQEDIARLAHRLATFHGSAPTDDAIRAYGTRPVVADTIAMTLETMDRVAHATQDSPTRQALRSYLEGFLEAYSCLFAQRAAEDRTRVGFSGSGKSVFARALAPRLSAVHLSSDSMRKASAGVSAGRRLDSACYTASRRADVYRALRECAARYLAQGRHVLIDATFLNPPERVAAACLARDNDAEFWMLECRARDALIRQRLQARRADPYASDADLVVYEAQRFDQSQAGPILPTTSAPSHLLCVDTSRPAIEAAHEIVERFAAQSAI